MKYLVLTFIIFFSLDSFAIFSTKSKKVKLPSIEGRVVNNTSIPMSELKLTINILCRSESPVPYSGCNRKSVHLKIDEDGNFHMPRSRFYFTYFRGDWVDISYSAYVINTSDSNEMPFEIYTDSKKELLESLRSVIILTE